MSRAAAIKQGYTSGARRFAARSITGLARTRVTPNALTATGVALCGLAAILVLFESRDAKEGIAASIEKRKSTFTGE